MQIAYQNKPHFTFNISSEERISLEAVCDTLLNIANVLEDVNCDEVVNIHTGECFDVSELHRACGIISGLSCNISTWEVKR